MINNTEFSKRLKKILDYYQLSASQFAEKIKVQRSSISHLLSGRNKPSLDFVLKVLENFEEVELYWLLNGKGSFPKKNKKEDYPTSLFDENKSDIEDSISKIQTNPSSASKQNAPILNKINEIDKIVIFYKDGTFKQYNEL